MLKQLFAATAVAVMTASCASIVSGSTQDISIKSSPEEADVVITDAQGSTVFEGRTPTVANLSRGSGFSGARYKVEFSKPGFENAQTSITTTVNNWVWGNLFIGGVIGIVVDGATGAMFKLTPEMVEGSLPGGQAMGPGQLLIIMKKDLPADVQEKLVPVT